VSVLTAAALRAVLMALLWWLTSAVLGGKGKRERGKEGGKEEGEGGKEGGGMGNQMQ